MDYISLFGKDFLYKDYDCSFNPISFNKRSPLFNLYIQITDICNANCDFCEKPDKKQITNSLDRNKIYEIVKELHQRNILGRISITGGEPLLCIDKLNELLEILSSIDKNLYVSLNTNASFIDRFYQIKNVNLIKEIDISRHHYDEIKNKNIFHIDVPDILHIHEFKKLYSNISIKLNCVLTKGNIDSAEELQRYLEYVSNYNIDEVRFIGLLPLTDMFKELYINPTDIEKGLEYLLTIGKLYDKNICECNGYIYIASNGNVVKAFLRNTKEINCNYVRQLVFNAQNYLLDGFNGKIII